MCPKYFFWNPHVPNYRLSFPRKFLGFFRIYFSWFEIFICDSSSTCKLGTIFINVKYVLVSLKLVCVYVKLLKT
jgi:hypothetical protein